jgi:eukaryotic-like serine/threonine-protein kinase
VPDPDVPTSRENLKALEMLTGRHAFQGAGAVELLNSVLHDEPPPPSQGDPHIPEALDVVALRCLAKDPADRFQSARDLAFHLTSLSGLLSRGKNQLASRPPRRWLPYGASGLVALALLTGAYEINRRFWARAHGPILVSFQQLTDQPGEERQAQIGPGGTNFVFVGDAAGNPDIYQQRVGGHNPVNLTPDSPEADTAPAISPDGERIAFRSERDGGGIFVMGSTGESVKRLTDFGYDAAWSPDGKQIVFSDHSGASPWSRSGPAHLWLVPSLGG